MRKLSLADLKDRISWGSVFGGVMTVLAISVLLSILNSSIGLFMLDPLSEHPASGIGTAVGIGSAVILIVSMAARRICCRKTSGHGRNDTWFSCLGNNPYCCCHIGNLPGCRSCKNDRQCFGSRLICYR